MYLPFCTRHYIVDFLPGSEGMEVLSSSFAFVVVGDVVVKSVTLTVVGFDGIEVVEGAAESGGSCHARHNYIRAINSHYLPAPQPH